jgi:hypothetical protein
MVVVPPQQQSLLHRSGLKTAQRKKHFLRLCQSFFFLAVAFLSLVTLIWNATQFGNHGSIPTILLPGGFNKQPSSLELSSVQATTMTRVEYITNDSIMSVQANAEQQGRHHHDAQGHQTPRIVLSTAAPPQSSATADASPAKRKDGKTKKHKKGDHKLFPEKAIFKQSDLVVVLSAASNTTTTYDSHIETEKPFVEVQPNDFIYSRSGWNSAPVVIHSHKLIFFTVQKVGCTVWKQLMRRMMGYPDWREKDPANPKNNGLRYLYHYNLTEATRLMNSPHYTRAIFVRDPKEKFLSAFIDKAYRGMGGYAMRICGCRPEERQADCRGRLQRFAGFVEETRTCYDSHWGPQSERMETKYLSTLDFVGHFDTIEEDTVRLLQQIGAYEAFGALGWGKYGNESIYHSTGTVTHASGKTASLLATHYTLALEEEIDERFANDYNVPQFGLSKKKIAYDKNTA